LLTLPNGQKLQTPKLTGPPGGGVYFQSQPTLKPSQQYTQRLLLNEWYDFPIVGEYRVKLVSDVTFKNTAEQSVSSSAPNEFVLKVGTQNNEQLRSICNGLATKALSEAEVQPRVEAAIALSYVQDPIAIPYLSFLLESGTPGAKNVNGYALTGHPRIGTDEALEVLLSAWGRADSEDKRSIASALQSAEKRTNNQNLKARIQVVLQQYR